MAANIPKEKFVIVGAETAEAEKIGRELFERYLAPF